MVINEYRRRFRKHRVPEDLPGVLPEPGTAPPEPGPHPALLDALRALGPRQRAVLPAAPYPVVTDVPPGPGAPRA